MQGETRRYRWPRPGRENDQRPELRQQYPSLPPTTRAPRSSLSTTTRSASTAEPHPAPRDLQTYRASIPPPATPPAWQRKACSARTPTSWRAGRLTRRLSCAMHTRTAVEMDGPASSRMWDGRKRRIGSSRRRYEQRTMRGSRARPSRLSSKSSEGRQHICVSTQH